MNLPQIAHLSKQKHNKSTKAAKLYQYPAPDEGGEESDVSAASRGYEPYFTAKIYDRDAGYSDWSIDAGDICIIGNNKQIIKLASYFIKHCPSQIESLSAGDYMRAKAGLSFHESRVKLVLIDLARTSPEHIERVARLCSRVLYYRPEQLHLYCDYTRSYRVTGLAMGQVSAVAASVGIDRMELIQRMYSVGEKEFLELYEGEVNVKALLIDTKQIMDRGVRHV